MSASIMDKVARAKEAVPAISPDELKGMLGRDDVLVVDVRDHPEVSENGKVKGALHVTRGMLEFRADPSLPSHNPAFSRDKTVVLYCGTGGRSALSGVALQELGYENVRNLGGFSGWVEAGGETEPA